MKVIFLEDRPFFPVSLLQGESVNNKLNWVVPLESTVLLLNLRKEIGSSTAQPAPIQDPNHHEITGNVDEIEVMVEMIGDEAKWDHLGNLDKYDPSIDIFIALREGLMFKKTDGRCIEVFTFVWDNLITWRTKKQGVVTRSNAEAKYKVMSLEICKEI
ncbi:putative mitochondrial protein [Cucumis melo var. makuwa]|uniref:Putative mitochondrial protein n=1 Tax=Cucumis melo var. makuwa TaxID=1194695 RepID=A0A5D3CX79_CUCMM|nr:putative mitochondrial protein [Cucumis melo var. makuwa]